MQTTICKDEDCDGIDQWYLDIKKQLTTKARENYLKRLHKIICIVSGKLSHYDKKFVIGEIKKQSMWQCIANDIDSWKGVEITACTKQKTNYKSYAVTSRNWWNRNKAKVYGNHFFHPVIFVHVKQSVYALNLSQQQKECLFVDVFDEILHAKIQFPQTRAQPIIPYQSFIQPNKFKYSSIDLLKAHGIHWSGKNIDIPLAINTEARNSYYIKDKDRSLKVNNSFMDSLTLLKQRLHSELEIKKEPTLKKEFKIDSDSVNQRTPPSVKRHIDEAKVFISDIPPNVQYAPNVIHGIPNQMDTTLGGLTMPSSLVSNTYTCTSSHHQIRSNCNQTTYSNVTPLMNALFANNSPTSPQSTNLSPLSMLSPIPDNPQPNNNHISYGACRGQNHSVSNHRYSPILPFILQNAKCSIETDPLSGKIKLHYTGCLPLN